MSVPRENKVCLTYGEVTSLTSTAGLNQDTVYNLNGLFDPDQTFTGHQPQSRDQWANFYNRYRVDGCTVEITWITTSIASMVGLLGNNDVTGITDPQIIIESPDSIIKSITTGGNSVTIKKYYDLAQINGVSRSKYNADDRYQAAMTSNPVETLAAHVCLFNASATTYTFMTKIYYYVTFFDPVQLSTS